MRDIKATGQLEEIANGKIDRPQLALLQQAAIRSTNVRLPYMWELRFPFVLAALALAMAVIDAGLLRDWDALSLWLQHSLQ